MKKRLGLKLSSLCVSLALIMTLMVPTFAAASTIQLTANRSEPLVIDAGDTQVLDLNGYLMTGKVVNNGILTIIDSQTSGKIEVTGDHVIMNTGTLTINGGTFDALSHIKAALWNEPGGNVTINGGTFLRSNESGSNSGTNGGNSYYNILNHGVMTFNQGTVLQTGQYSSLFENGWQDGNMNIGGEDSRLIINGGTFSGGLNTIKNDDYGNLKINGGTFRNVAQASFLNWNVAEINGGVFTSDNGVILNGFLNQTMNQGKLTITGGTYNSGNNKPAISQMGGSTHIGTIVVKGGTYNHNVGVDVETGYKAYLVDGLFKVAPTTTKIVLSSTSLEIEIGKSAMLTSTLTPITTLDKVTYSSSDESIATVSASGVVNAKKAGTIKITATAGQKTATCIVTVKETPKTPDVPSINPPEPTPPSDKVQVDIKDNESKQIIDSSVTNILGDVLTGKDVPTSVMSSDTLKAVQEALTSGKTVIPVVENKLVDRNQVSNQQIVKINDLVSQMEKTNHSKVTVAQYLDLSVSLTADNEVLGTMNRLEKPVTFVVSLPEGLQKDGRVFTVIRVHDGVAEKLKTTLVDGKLLFETDRFSTYALVYEDGVASDTVVKTNDSSDVTLFASMALLALVSGSLVLNRKRKEF